MNAPLLGQLVHFSHHAGQVQQGLTGNTASQQAGTTETWICFHEYDIMSLVSSQESSGITTRSTTQNDQRGTHGSYRDKNSTIVFTSTGKLISEADGKP